jgi:hypothetical protein
MLTRHVEMMLCAAAALGFVGCHTPAKAPPHTAAAPSEALVLGKLAVQYPAFRTIEDLKQALVDPYQSTARLFLFERGGVRAALCAQPSGGIGWHALIVYTFDARREQWYPVAVWNTYAMDVRAVFNKWSGTIDVRSGGGTLIFRVNISALKARATPFGW